MGARRVNWEGGTNLSGERLKHLRVPDDCVLIAENTIRLQNTRRELDARSRPRGTEESPLQREMPWVGHLARSLNNSQWRTNGGGQDIAMRPAQEAELGQGRRNFVRVQFWPGGFSLEGNK
ncbi:hypothetical protein KIL84_006025 [Mauremys mutica]|uniref:Uncharacterized protein n=1 Tax=Mauremys mutica TaxID=74926 RepID=A0A9D3XJ28_9SAUR|nr:hypothetical protein KIL84_006025 [Mauremys mutica]